MRTLETRIFGGRMGEGGGVVQFPYLKSLLGTGIEVLQEAGSQRAAGAVTPHTGNPTTLIWHLAPRALAAHSSLLSPLKYFSSQESIRLFSEETDRSQLGIQDLPRFGFFHITFPFFKKGPFLSTKHIMG